MRPESGNKIDMIILIVVVLPAPLGPMKPHRAPRGTARWKSSTAFCAPKPFVTPSSTTAASATAGSEEIMPSATSSFAITLAWSFIIGVRSRPVDDDRGTVAYSDAVCPQTSAEFRGPGHHRRRDEPRTGWEG